MKTFSVSRGGFKGTALTCAGYPEMQLCETELIICTGFLIRPKLLQIKAQWRPPNEIFVLGKAHTCEIGFWFQIAYRERQLLLQIRINIYKDAIGLTLPGPEVIRTFLTTADLEVSVCFKNSLSLIFWISAKLNKMQFYFVYSISKHQICYSECLPSHLAEYTLWARFT